MEKQKPWQLVLILAVLALTLFNILPTVFYYSKPLKEPVDSVYAESVAKNMVTRLQQEEQDSVSWLKAFCKQLKIKPVSISIDANNAKLIELVLSSEKEAKIIKKILPKAGTLIPFVPARLEVSSIPTPKKNVVVVERKIGIHLDEKDIEDIFTFSFKTETNGGPTEAYKNLINDRVTEVTLALGGVPREARELSYALSQPNNQKFDVLIVQLASEIEDIAKVFGEKNSIAHRLFASYVQSPSSESRELTGKLLERITALHIKKENELSELVKEKEYLTSKDLLVDSAIEEKKSALEKDLKTLTYTKGLFKKEKEAFTVKASPLDRELIGTKLEETFKFVDFTTHIQTLDIGAFHPFVQTLLVDWSDGTLTLKLHKDVQQLLMQDVELEEDNFLKEKLQQRVFNEIARVSQVADEEISPYKAAYQIQLNHLTNSSSFLTLDLSKIAKKQAEQTSKSILASWTPKHADLLREQYPVVSFEEYKKLAPQEQKLSLLVYVPMLKERSLPEGFRPSSIYVIARGMQTIANKYEAIPDAEDAKVFTEDFQTLARNLQQSGFIGYLGGAFGLSDEFKDDYIFELTDYFNSLVSGTREDLYIHGSKNFAVLEFTDIEQRILADNRIDDKIHEDLLKWQDAYYAAQVDLNSSVKYTVPALTKSTVLQNIKLSFKKYFRGDDRKILKWGLDLSGGKSVRIGLQDQNQRPVKNPEDLKQASEELYSRINKMGVAERSIRIENENIVLDFPGSQGLSASDLIQASTMHFHIVNEKFGRKNQDLAASVEGFLQEVWNEAVVTNRKNIEDLNEIAWRHLGGGQKGEDTWQPINEHAKVLFENDLKLVNLKDSEMTNSFDDTFSMVTRYRGEDYSAWNGQTHPLLIVFHHSALEGSSLKNVQAGSDPRQGNILSFGVSNSYQNAEKLGSPRADLYSWTSQFSQDDIAGTPKQAYSSGDGWRMAVLLNGVVISDPTLNSALRDGGQISGKFSQREILQLVADLKAGSLTFAPKILSETNISPELGLEERYKGVMSAFIGIAAIFLIMVSYYRLAGIVAFSAVVINLFILWAVLQNIGAALSLAGIAGIVLTIGMAVDANVLVFERIREEFAKSGRIASAIQTGYKKAFSAIIDSNITTILAAFILVQFDSGPIKGFAITLMIGIVSSMFTALFMTRYFFAGWVKNKKNTELSMGTIVGSTKFNFLNSAKPTFVISALLIVVGSYFLVMERHTIFGMDFTGGYSLTVDFEEVQEKPYRLDAIEAIAKAGVPSTTFQVQQLSRENQLRLQFGIGMEEEGLPFHGMVEELKEGSFQYKYEKNPRITWVVNALEEAGLKIQKPQLEILDSNWSVMSGQFSETMRNNALMALGAALFGILMYITVRFEFKFAMGAVLALAHDAIVTLGVLAVFHKIGAPVEIDLQVVGAIMTIIGYSLNDTIIIFDRIREDLTLYRKKSFEEIINHAINITLGRTLLTSGTTLTVLICMVLFGGSSIFSFSLVMTVGVLVGTLSSLFIASPLMLFFHNRELEKKQRALEVSVV